MNNAIKNRNGQLGFDFESLFQNTLQEAGIKVERFDTLNPKNPDFLIQDMWLFDTKFKKEVYRNALRDVGIEPTNCVAIDMCRIKEYERASEDSGMPAYLFIKVEFEHNDKSNFNTYLLSLNRIKQLLTIHKNRIKYLMDYEKEEYVYKFYVSTKEMNKVSFDELILALK